MNLLSVLHVERAYKLKKKFSVFFSQFVAKKEVISTLLTWISSVLRKAAIVPLFLFFHDINGYHSKTAASLLRLFAR